MTLILDFFRTMWLMPKPWVAWIGLLIVVNVVVPLFFLPRPEAWATLAAISISFLTMLAIFKTLGFVRLLGLGHLVAWPPLLLWLWPRLEGVAPATALSQWLLALVAINLVSLVIDAIDLVRYLRGERAPMYALPAKG